MIVNKLLIFFVAAFLLNAAPAKAGLFSDTEARAQIKQLEVRLAAAEDLISKLDAANKQQTSALLDLQTLLDTQSTEMRKLRGMNEEFAHNLEDSEKRQKDFYVDLDGRLRRFETADAALAAAAKIKPEDTVGENHALEEAYGFYKFEHYQDAVSAFQGFLVSYPKSTHTANVRYWLGNAYFILKDYKNSLENLQIIIDKFDTFPKIADVMFNIADCQQMLNNNEAAKVTLKQIVTKFPNSDSAAKAQKELATLK